MNTSEGLIALRNNYRSQYYKDSLSSIAAKRAKVIRDLRLKIISLILQDRITTFRR